MKSWVFGTWNEIGAKNEHFNFATLSDKQIVSFYHAKSSILPKNIQLQTQNKMQKKNGRDDFKNILSNLQHRNHRITKLMIHLDSLGFPI